MLVLFFVLIAFSANADDGQSEELKRGYQHMYNLEFDAAHKTFQDWQTTHPEDPLGPVSEASAYLFSEFNRLKILQLELFADDDKFESRDKLKADPEIKKSFDKQLSKVDELATKRLAVSP